MEYEVSPDIREKEKIVGGIFTISQIIFIGIALGVGGVLALWAYSSTQSIGLTVIAAVFGAIWFIPFGVIRIEKLGNMELFPYLMIRLKYKYSKKIYININENKKKSLMEKK